MTEDPGHSEATTDEKPNAKPYSTRELIYGAILVVGVTSIVSGLNGVFLWGWSDMVVLTVGVVVGGAAAYGLSWLRKR
jgi:hypothetical protein